MDAKPQTVELYLSNNGKCPYIDWFRSVRDQRAKQRVAARIRRLELGNFGDFKSVGKGVGELRIMHGPGYRIYYGCENDEVVILLIGGTKPTQEADIATAQHYWADWQARKKEADDA